MMKHVRVTALAAAALALLCAAPAAQAQSDILLRLRSGSPLGDRFRVDSAGGVVALGQIGFGIIPASGAGWRMMWYPHKVAFRAGYADAGGQFDDANIGYYSWAGGALNTAAGIYSFAMGNQNTVEAVGAVRHGAGERQQGVGERRQHRHLRHRAGAEQRRAGPRRRGHRPERLERRRRGRWRIGYRTTADADYSMAFGYRASTNGHTGAKVFGDASTTDSIEAVANNEFAVRAAGGFRFRTNATLTNGCNIAAGGASITCASSRTLKENYFTVDGEDVLRRMRGIPVTTWNYIDEGRQSRHLGPFAEDFWNAFRLGDDPRGIGHLDIDGVNFAGIKALEARTTQQAERIRALEAQTAEQAERIRTLDAQLAELRQMVQALAAAKQP